MTRAQVLGAVAIGAIALAYALPMQSVGCAQNAHYAAARAVADGTPRIDKWAEETCDLVRVNGHYYAAKGPAMDFWTAPWYLLLRTLHAVPPNKNIGLGYPDAMVGVPLRAIWQMGLWAVVLPALGLLLLVRRMVERIEPGLGTAVAAILGLATLVHAVLDAPVRARARRGARLSRVLPALRRSLATPRGRGRCSGGPGGRRRPPARAAGGRARALRRLAHATPAEARRVRAGRSRSG